MKSYIFACNYETMGCRRTVPGNYFDSQRKIMLQDMQSKHREDPHPQYLKSNVPSALLFGRPP
jgi:hypothetical protein